MYCKIAGDADRGTKTPLRNIIGKRIEFTTIIIFRGSLMIIAMKTPIEEKAIVAKILAIVRRIGSPNWIPRNGKVMNVVINETNRPNTKLPTTLPITISQYLSGANINLSNSLNRLSKVIAVDAIEVAPKNEAIAINPGAKKLTSRPLTMNAIANTIGKIMPQLIVAGLMKYWKKSFLAK